MVKRIVVLGAGGHAKVVIAAAQAAGIVVDSVLDDDPALHGTKVLGVPVAGPIDEDAVAPGASAVIAIGSNSVRQDLANRLDCSWAAVIHPRAIVHSSVEVGPGTVVCAGAVVQPDAVVGRHSILNTSSSVDHDCRVGDFAHLSPGVRLAGNCSVGDGALMGIASSMIPGTRVGKWAVVGAAAVVIRHVPDRTVAVGVPARPVKKAD